MFASEDARADSVASGPIQRTVPALILGAPPPRSPQMQPADSGISGLGISTAPAARNQQPTRSQFLAHGLSVDTGSNNTSGTRSTSNKQGISPQAGATTGVGADVGCDNEDDHLPQRPRGRSEAQELADFLNSTAPPAPPPSESVRVNSSGNDEPLKSGKSFKSFVSRMTGRKKDAQKDGGPVPPLPRSTSLSSSASHSQLGGLNVARRQKSSSTFAGDQPQPKSQTRPPQLNESISSSALRGGYELEGWSCR